MTARILFHDALVKPFMETLLTTPGDGSTDPQPKPSSSGAQKHPLDTEKKSGAGRKSPSSPERKKPRRIAGVPLAPSNTTPVLSELPKFWVIKKKEGDSFSKVSPILINRQLKALVGEVDSVAKTGSGVLVVGVANQKQAQKIKSLSSLGDLAVEVSEHQALNSSRGVIYCRDLMNCSVEELKEELQNENVIDVRQVMRRVGKDKTEPTGTYFLTFRTPDPPERIRVGFYRGIRVRRYIPAPLRCFKCLKFGHVSARCKQMHETCACGKATHIGTPCEAPKCVNCNGNHTSRSRECPEFVLEKEIQRVKAENKLAYPEARRLVRDKAYAMPAVSYAAKVAAKKQSPAVQPQAAPVTEPAEQKVVSEKLTRNQQKKQRRRLRKVATSPTESTPGAKPAGDSVRPATSGPSPKAAPSVKERGCNTSPPRRRSPIVPRPPRYNQNRTNVVEVEGTSETEVDDNSFVDAPVSSRQRRKKGWPKGKPRTSSV